MRKIFRKSLVFMLSAAMALSFAMPAKKAQADTYDQTFNVSTAAELAEAVGIINGDTSGTGNYLINITANISSGFEVTVSRNTVTVNGNNNTMTCEDTSGVAAVAGDGSVLKLENIVLKAIGEIHEGCGIVTSTEKGLLIINDGTVIKDSIGNNNIGGGVNVTCASLIMNGGTIENCGINGGSVCYGGGIGIFNGSFIMNGGTIKNCYVQSPATKANIVQPTTAGGGIFVSLYSLFTMNGGTIEGCTAQSADAVGGGIAVLGHMNEAADYGYYGNVGSSFEMKSGSIVRGCSASLLGGGVYVAGTAIKPVPAGTILYDIVPPGHSLGADISGGTITGNECTNAYGGGVAFFWVRQLARIQNTTISDNCAPYGGGVSVFEAYTSATLNNCTITGNESDGEGGGVYVESNTQSNGTTISNSTITDNTSGAIGAGVFYDGDSTLKISGANEIQDNTYGGKDNNLNIFSSDNLVQVVGSLAGSQIGLSDPTLWNDGKSDADPTAVSTAKLTSGYKTYNGNNNPNKYFTSDHATWEPDFSDVDENEVRLVRKNSSEIAGGNIIVDGVISVTLWAKLDASSEAEREAYSMKFTSGSDTKTVAYDASKNTTHEGDTYYGFTYKVNTVQMADVITGELLQDGSETGVEKDYSVQTYGENMLEKSNDIVLKDMLTYLLNYGAFSQTYFDYNTSNLPNVNCDKSDDITNTDIDSKYEYDIEDDSLAGIDVKKSLSLGINKGVNVTFKFYASSDVDMDEYKASLSSDESDPFFVQEDGVTTYTTENMPFTKFEGVDNKLYTINLLNVPASRFDDMLTLTVAKDGDPSNKYQVKFSVFSYAYAVCNDDAEYTDTSQIKPAKMNDLKNLLKSMYVYNDKMEKYAKANPSLITRYKITDSQ